MVRTIDWRRLLNDVKRKEVEKRVSEEKMKMEQVEEKLVMMEMEEDEKVEEGDEKMEKKRRWNAEFEAVHKVRHARGGRGPEKV